MRKALQRAKKPRVHFLTLLYSSSPSSGSDAVYWLCKGLQSCFRLCQSGASRAWGQRLACWPLAIWDAAGASRTQADDGLTFVRSLSLYLPEIALKEPSGLSVGASEDGCWIVDDRTGVVFWLDEGGGCWVSDTGEHVDFLTRDLADARRFDLHWTSQDKRRHLQNAEGVALLTDGAFLFVLADDGRGSKLVQYEIDPGL